MFHKFKKILSIIIFHFNEYKYKKKYRKYFNNEFLVKNIKKIKQKNLNIFSKYIYDKEFRLLKHRYERYMNISKILVEIKKSKKEICVVEFGVYRGDSYLFFSKNLNYEKNKIIGIDTFKDFPKSNRRWKKGKFTNTSKNLVEKLLNKYNLKCKNFLIESDFNNKNLKKKLSVLQIKLTYFTLIVINMKVQFKHYQFQNHLYLIKKFHIYVLTIGVVLKIKCQRHLANFFNNIKIKYDMK